jgi:hypothetical protein
MTIRRRQVRAPRKYRDVYGNVMIDGYTFMGRNRVPPMPNRIAMRDRTTGEEKVLSHDATPGDIDLVDVNTRWSDVTHYGAHDGPYFGDYRLYLDNGTLAAEYALGHGSQTILTRKNFETTVLKITIDQTDGTVVYTEYDL